MGRQRSPWIDATTATPEPTAVSESTLAAQAEVERFTGAGGTGVVLRFGMFYGPGSSHTATLLRMARWGLAYCGGAPGGYTSSIHVDDAASAVVAALGVPAGVYDVVDDRPLTRRQYADALAVAAGRPHYVRGPGRMLRWGGAQAALLLRSQRVSNRRFREAAGWAPRWRGADQGLAALAAVSPDPGGPVAPRSGPASP